MAKLDLFINGSLLWGRPIQKWLLTLLRANQIFSFEGMYVDKTGIGDAMVDELENIGIRNIEGVFFTEGKREYVELPQIAHGEKAAIYSRRG